MLGYAGRLMRVDLSSGVVRDEELSEGLARDFVGGRGFGVAILSRELRAGIDPLSDANKLVFAVGPFEGSGLPGGSRLTVTAKSPLTGLLGDSDFGGSFPAHLKRAGYDAIIIEGKSDRPVYLWTDGRKAGLRSAEAVWGKDVLAAQRAMLDEVGVPEAKVVTVGPAAERLVRYACIASEARFFAGRSGLGAVMASKNLKGIVVWGEGPQTFQAARPRELKELARSINRDIATGGSCDTLSKYGTWNTTAPANLNGVIPVRNFQVAGLDDISTIDGDAMLRTIYVGSLTCPGCPIGCRRVVSYHGAYDVSSDVGGPQYETVAALGPLVGNTDPVLIAKANELCNLYGLDTISTGVCIAFAMECYERGLLSASDVGFPLEWGSAEAILGMIEAIAQRRGLGDVLAEGVWRAAARVGRGSEAWAMHVKGMELPMHDPRGKKGQGLSYATSMKGADHMEACHDEAFERVGAFEALGFGTPMSRRSLDGKPRLVKVTQDYWGALADSLVVCKLPLAPFRPFTPDRVAAAVGHITGWDVTLEDLLRVGERIYNLARLFAVREASASAASALAVRDELPARLSEALATGGSAGERMDPEAFSAALREYYRERGWTDEGVPTRERLDSLGLSDTPVDSIDK